MIFETRKPFVPVIHGEWEASAFERYLEGRTRYKTELIESLVGHISLGPVLEAGNGYGLIGVELLGRKRFELHCLCEESLARVLYERKLRDHGLWDHCRLCARSEGAWPFSPGSFELVYSVNCLHEWETPLSMLQELWGLVREGGLLVINDLKRDADPFITEYIIREMAAVETEEGRFHLQSFLKSLQSAWSVAEVRHLLEDAQLGRFELVADDAMTLTLRLRK